MNQKIAVGVVVGIVLGALGAVMSGGFTFGSNETAHYWVAKKSSSDGCEWVLKQDAFATNGKKLTLRFHGKCVDAGDEFVVGNFRLDKDLPGSGDCRDATAGTDWPFNSDDQDLSKRTTGQNGKIDLRDAKATNGTLTVYYFDLCVNKTMVDPRLVIEP